MSRHPSPQFALARAHLSACSARLSYGSYRHLGQQLLAAFAVNAVCIAALFVLPDAEIRPSGAENVAGVVSFAEALLEQHRRRVEV